MWLMRGDTLADIRAVAADIAILAPLFLGIVEQHPKRAQLFDSKRKKLIQILEQVWNKFIKLEQIRVHLIR